MARRRTEIPASTPPSLAPLAFSYLRFSSPEQAKGDSLRRQTELRDAWLAKSGAILDTSLTLRDEGVSGFTGNHRENPDRHALAAFLELVERGRVPRGSFLIVESLDRLSREHVQDALRLLLNLTNKGIKVVQLIPVEQVFDDKSDAMPLMMAIMELSRGNAESQMKSERIGRAWREKKRLAADDGIVLTKRSPAWLTVVDGRFVIREDAAAVIRRVFALAIAGHGAGAIAKLFNAEGVPPLGHAEAWPHSSVMKILSNRAVIGEYQPFKGHGFKGRKTDGEPIPGYYPAVVTEGEFHAARAALAGRRKAGGGRKGKRVNLFSGLARDGRDGAPLHRVDKGKRATAALVSSKAVAGVPGSEYISFPIEVFERSILSQLREIDPRSILPANDGWAEKLMTLAGRLADIEARIEKIKASLLADGDVVSLVDVLRKLEAEKTATAADLARARQEAASPLSEAWGEYRSLVDALDASTEPDALRLRIRTALRRMVDAVWCVFAAKGTTRIAAIQVWFTEGGHRDYVIRHEPKRVNGSGSKPEATRVWSAVDGMDLGKIDLRKRADAIELAGSLPKLVKSI